MGEVFRATDSKLGRDVALKVLPSDVARDPERLARFQREARAVAALNHPHIVTLYSVEEADGVHFLTMELVEGQSLDRLIPDGGLPVEQIIAFANALADAIAAAHDKGIVHRDLKPANVMITNDGRVKVLDFGLAKESGADTPNDATMTSAHHTQPGMVMGTPGYMSPEQVAGRPLDHRTDIFSLGVMLYEMSLGKRPFQGGSSAELISAILRDTPPPVTDLRPDLPADLARIIRRCLEKDPRHRMQTARDVSNEARELSRQYAPSASAITSSTTQAAAVPGSGAARTDEGFWVAVLPFRYTGSNSDLAALGDGLVEEIITGFSRFSYMRVIARGSTARYANESGDVRAIGKELGARYVLQGNLRQAGAKLRVAVQLLDAATGAHLWAETYERSFHAEAIFELQDELVPKIVSTLSDAQGVLPRSMGESLRSKKAGELTPYEAVLRSFAYLQRISPEEHSLAREALEAAVERAPDYAPAWAMLAIMIREEYSQAFNPRPDPLVRGYTAARRAIEISPSDNLGFNALASIQYLRGESAAFLISAERAIQLNPMDGFTLAYMGFMFAYTGEWERGCELSKQARSLNPHHPGWYWFADAFQAFRQGDYDQARAVLEKVNMPNFWRMNLALASACGHLGDLEAAQHALRALLAVKPNFAREARGECAKWWRPELVEQILDGLSQAGLEIGENSGSVHTTPVSSRTSANSVTPRDSGTTRAAEGFWVAVLPFKYGGNNADLTALAEGLSEDVVTGLSRFSYLRVIARGSTQKYSTEAGDTRSIGKELGARYVMEGSLRQAASKLRLAVQLVDATSGAHLWAENYERTYSPEAIFELQDDLVPRIVSTVADMNGILARTMSEALRGLAAEQLSPYEAVLRSFCYLARVSADELAAARSGLELAVRKAPAYADAWAMLSLLCVQDYGQGFNLQPDSLSTGLAAARRAIEASTSSPLAYFGLAQALFFEKDFQSFRNAADRAVALNPMDGNSMAFLGELLTYTGDRERGLALAGRAKQLNPNHPGWYWFADFYNAYRESDYRTALDFAVKINLPGQWAALAMTAAAAGQFGDRNTASKAVSDLLKLRPDIASGVRREFAKWWEADYIEHVIDGLREAGLEIPDELPKSSPSLVTPASGITAARSIAVLPFANMSGDKEQEYFSDGLAEEIINLLAQTPGLKVIARTSAFAFRGKEQDIRAIAATLGVSTILEGSVRRSGERLRVTAQLISALDGGHLFSERYDRVMADIFGLQDEIAAAITGALRIKLATDAPTPHRYVPKTDAYEAFLKARYHEVRFTPEALDLAFQYYEQAITLDPGFALAQVGLGIYHMDSTYWGRRPASETLPLARHQAEQALLLDPALPEAHALMGYIEAHDFQWQQAGAHFDLGMRCPPTSILVRRLFAIFEFLRGNLQRAIEVVKTIIQEDPLAVWPRMNLNAFLQGAERYGEAIEQLRKVLELDENLVVARVTLALLLADRGDLAQASIEARRAYEAAPWYPDATAILAGLLHQSGEENEAERLMSAMCAGPGLECHARSVYHLLCGDTDEGADWAEKALAERDYVMMFYLQFAVSKGLRTSSRWPRIAEMMNLPNVRAARYS